MNFNELKKIELHLHLDGSVRISTASFLLNKSVSELTSLMQATELNSLTEYLTKFDIPVKLMQKKENLERITYELCEDLKLDNVIYAEIRFAPIKHTNNINLDEVVLSVLNGIKKSNIKANLILCCMRGDTIENNNYVIDIAYKYLNKGVCAIDLAGDELHYPNYLYEYIFNKCKKLNIPYTIHSGEADGIESIRKAISYDTKRIGHGIRAIEDKNIIEMIKQKNITLEICPTSNLNTRVVDNIKNHPINKLYKQGIKVTINTDNRTVSNTNLNKEYKLLYDTFGFTKEDFIKFNKNAIEASFLSEAEKNKLLIDIEK